MSRQRVGQLRASTDTDADRAQSNGRAAAVDHPASVAPAVKSLAPYYHDDLVDIYNADSTDLSFLAEQSVQLVVTSPPYNLGKDYGKARDDATYQSYLDWV